MMWGFMFNPKNEMKSLAVPTSFGKALTQRAMCISGTKYLFVFNSDKWSVPQSLFIVTQSLGLSLMHFKLEILSDGME